MPIEPEIAVRETEVEAKKPYAVTKLLVAEMRQLKEEEDFPALKKLFYDQMTLAGADGKKKEFDILSKLMLKAMSEINKPSSAPTPQKTKTKGARRLTPEEAAANLLRVEQDKAKIRQRSIQERARSTILQLIAKQKLKGQDRRRDKFDAELKQLKQQELNEQERQNSILRRLNYIDINDQIKLLDSKGKVVEIHTVKRVNFDQKAIDVDIFYPNRRTRQELKDRHRFFKDYTNKSNAAEIEVVSMPPTEKEMQSKELIAKISQLKIGDKIKLLNVKSGKEEIHIITKISPPPKFEFQVNIHSAKTDKLLRVRTREHSYYTDPELALNVEIAAGKEINLNYCEIIGENNDIGLSASIKTFITQKGSQIAGASDKGLFYKDHNEDRVVIAPELESITLIDGMGGYSGGDKAAQILAMRISEFPTDIDKAIKLASKDIDTAIRSKEIKNKKAGAAFISAQVIRKEKSISLEYSYAGDCSLLVLDSYGKVKHIGKSDPYLNSPSYLKNNNGQALPEDVLLYHPQRNRIMGTIDRSRKKFKSETLSVKTGDRVILMSDGISDNLTPEEISRLIKNTTPENAIKILDQVTSERMNYAADIITQTEISETPNFDYSKDNNKIFHGRRAKGKYSDGYKSKPKNDNRGVIVLDI